MMSSLRYGSTAVIYVHHSNTECVHHCYVCPAKALTKWQSASEKQLTARLPSKADVQNTIINVKLLIIIDHVKTLPGTCGLYGQCGFECSTCKREKC